MIWSAIDWFAVALFWAGVIGFMGLLLWATFSPLFRQDDVDHQFGLPLTPPVDDERIRQTLGEHYLD